MRGQKRKGDGQGRRTPSGKRSSVAAPTPEDPATVMLADLASRREIDVAERDELAAALAAVQIRVDDWDHLLAGRPMATLPSVVAAATAAAANAAVVAAAIAAAPATAAPIAGPASSIANPASSVPLTVANHLNGAALPGTVATTTGTALPGTVATTTGTAPPGVAPPGPTNAASVAPGTAVIAVPVGSSLTSDGDATTTTSSLDDMASGEDDETNASDDA